MVLKVERGIEQSEHGAFGLIVVALTDTSIEELLLQIGRRFGDRAQLHQVREVEVLEPLWALIPCRGRVEATLELFHVRAPKVRSSENAFVKVDCAQVNVDACVQT